LRGTVGIAQNEEKCRENGRKKAKISRKTNANRERIVERKYSECREFVVRRGTASAATSIL